MKSFNSKIRTGMALLLMVATLYASEETGNSTDKPCKKERYATSEPGTCLDPKAYRVLTALDKIQTNPYNNEFARRILNFFEPRIHHQVDTLVPSTEYDIPVRIYYPTARSLSKPTQVIFFIHGGGFMYGSIEEYDMAVKKFAKISGKIVVSADYRLAPEHPYPAALNDVSAVLEWLNEHREAIGSNGNKIVVMGDSAGANLAAALAIRNRDENKDLILCQVLLYPPTTFEEIEFPSRRYFLRDELVSNLLSEEFVRLSRDSYLPDSLPDTHPYVSPLKADLSEHLPPSLIILAEADPLRDEGRLYAEALSENGQDVTLVEYPGMIHGFFNLYMVLDEGKDSMKLTRDFIRKMADTAPGH